MKFAPIPFQPATPAQGIGVYFFNIKIHLKTVISLKKN
jgi:hypothetical protein